MIDGLWFCLGGSGRNWLVFWMPAANRLVLLIVCSSKLTCFLSGWSISTWFQCGGSNLTWFRFKRSEWTCFVSGGRNWLGVLVVDRKYIPYGVLTDRCVCYVLKDHSVTVDWLTHWFIRAKRVSNCYMREKKTDSLCVCMFGKSPKHGIPLPVYIHSFWKHTTVVSK